MVFFLGAYGSLPDAAIWWCLRTGGGGVLTSVVLLFVVTGRICVTKLVIFLKLH